MNELLKQFASIHNAKLQLVPIKRLESIKKEIASFKEQEKLNDFQKWIVNALYQLDVPTLDFTIMSIVLIAIPHPFYAKVELEWQGKKYHCLSLVMSDFDNTDKYLNDFVVSKNYHINSAPNLPLKRLAVQSGLAVYGRNNICYIEGMGSSFSFNAYFSDIPCENDSWIKPQLADTCAKCNACINNCPTGAISPDRFLINNEKCLSYLNESAEEFPDWLPKSAHHSIYDCLKCQVSCPMNKSNVNNIIGPIKFSEEETDILLSGKSFATYPSTLKPKAKLLGLHQWPDGIPKNLKMIFALSDNQ
jgi:epoxyqueuosine reductase